MFRLSRRSLARLSGVHPDLQAVVRLAIEYTTVDFGVSEGRRSQARQQRLFDSGASKTLNSRHLTGHAVDLVAYVGAEVRWDWPLYHKINDAMAKASAKLGMPIEWGGYWKAFPDGPHFQLPWSHREHLALEGAPHLELKR